MGFGDLMKKAVYLGVGLASYAGEKAGKTLEELREQAQKAAQEMVEKGEINTEEARRLVDEWLAKAQQKPIEEPKVEEPPKAPRQIEILAEDEEPTPPSEAEKMRQQVADLQEELRRLQKNQ